MFSIKQISITTIGTMAIGLGSVVPVNAASFYQVTGLDFTPADINNSSQIVGGSYLWQNGNVTNLNTLSGANNSNLVAKAINNHGEIVGGGLNVNNLSGQVFISDGSTISHLPTDYSPIRSIDINDSGTVALVPAQAPNAIILERDGTVIEAVTNGRNFSDIAINNQSQIATYYSGGGVPFPGTAVFADNGNPPVILDPPSNANYPITPSSSANDINDLGNVVGSSGVFPLSGSQLKATLWTDVNQPGVSLGTLGGEFSNALGINNSQQVVGISALSDGSTEHAFLWEDGDLIDLNSLIDPESGWLLTSAFEINDSGDIIGIGFYNGVERGFVAKAVPEPSSVLGILGLGAFGVGSWLKRKQSRKLTF